MIVFWKGLGFLVAVIVFGFSLVFNLAFNAWRGEGYYDEHKWPFAISLFVSGVVCWVLGLALRRRTSKVVVEQDTGKELILNRSDHSLFFIPMHFWGPILIIGACIVLVVDLLK